MTAPVQGDPTRPGNKILVGLTAAVIAAVGLAVQQGKIHIPTAPASTVTTGCPDSLPGAIVIHFATIQPAGIRVDTTQKPVVVCGPASMVHGLEANPEGSKLDAAWPSGSPLDVKLFPPDTTSGSTIVSAPLDRGADSLHWAVTDSTTLKYEVLYRLVTDAVLSSKIKLDSAQYVTNNTPIVETDDTVPVDTVALGKGLLHNGPLPVWGVEGSPDGSTNFVPHYFYRPARGTWMRTFLESNTSAPGAPLAWMATWASKVDPVSTTVIDLTVIQASGTLLATLTAP